MFLTTSHRHSIGGQHGHCGMWMPCHAQDGSRNGGEELCKLSMLVLSHELIYCNAYYSITGTHWGVSSSTCDIRHGKGSESSSDDTRNSAPSQNWRQAQCWTRGSVDNIDEMKWWRSDLIEAFAFIAACQTKIIILCQPLPWHKYRRTPAYRRYSYSR